MMKIQYVFLAAIVSVLLSGCVTETTRSSVSTTDQTKKRVYTQEELQKTGQTDTGSALQKVDPSIQTSGPH
jgi:outer membrane biogenesis lipoprotein LolB